MLVSYNMDRIEIWLTLGFGFGLYSFLNGFRVFREYRLVEDTPECPIRSVPMGLVRVHGKAVGEATLLSPVTHQPCFFYKVDIEKWEQNSRRAEWKHYRTDIEGVRFELQDPTGSITVDPLGAKYDLLESAKREVNSGFSFGLGLPRSQETAAQAGTRRLATDQELLQYIEGGGANSISNLVSTLSTPLQRALVNAGPQSDPKKEQVRQAMLDATRHPAGSSEFVAQMRRVDSVHSLIIGGKPAAAVEPAEYSGGSWLAGSASGKYRLTEYCILPGHYYDVTGTCTENAGAPNVRSRNLITKGQNEPEFLISWRTPQGVETRLRNRAALRIFGGGGLAVACLGLLLGKLGLI